MMIQLLFIPVVAQMALILSLVFETPLKRLAMTALERRSQWRGRVISRTVEGVLLSAFASAVYGIMNANHRLIGAGPVNPTDEVIVADKILLASLTGFLLFFSMMIDKLHQILTEHSSLNTMIIVAEKQIEQRKCHAAERHKALEKEVGTLKTRIKALEFYIERQEYHASTARAKEIALRKQSEELKVEYELFKQTLRNQLKSFDQSLLLECNQKGRLTSLKSHTLLGGLNQFPWAIHKPTSSRVVLCRGIDVQITNNPSAHPLSSDIRAALLPVHRTPICQ